MVRNSNRDYGENREYFWKGNFENKEFWYRLGGKPDFTGKKVLDLGCGHGALCVDIARSGAKEVIGLDLDSERITFGRRFISEQFPELKNKIKLFCRDIKSLKNQNFDIIVSKDSFEHILNLKEVLQDMEKHLRKEGLMYIGFSPLYNAPLGDHGRLNAVIPFGHLIFPKKILLRRTSKIKQKRITKLEQLGLNGWSYAQYKTLFKEGRLKKLYFQSNSGHNPTLKLFKFLSSVKFLEEYFTQNIYLVLKKP